MHELTVVEGNFGDKFEIFGWASAVQAHTLDIASWVFRVGGWNHYCLWYGAGVWVAAYRRVWGGLRLMETGAWSSLGTSAQSGSRAFGNWQSPQSKGNWVELWLPRVEGRRVTSSPNWLGVGPRNDPWYRAGCWSHPTQRWRAVTGAPRAKQRSLKQNNSRLRLSFIY